MNADNTNRPVIAITRFQAKPEDADEVRARYAALVTKVRSADRGPVDEYLGQTEDGTWIAVWRWASAEALKKAQELAHSLPEAETAFALAADVTGDIVVLEAT